MTPYTKHNQLTIKTFKKILLFLLFFIFTTGFSQEKPEQIMWKEDIEFLRVELPKNHKNFYFKKSENDFDIGLNQIISQLDSLNDFSITIKLQQLIAGFGDSHTSIRGHYFIKKDEILPIGLYWFRDGIYIIKSSEENIDLLGAKIIRINEFPIATIIDSLSTLITVDNMAIVKNETPNLVPYAQLLKHFDFDNNGIYEIEAEFPNGEIVKKKIAPTTRDKIIRYKSDSIAHCWNNRNVAFSETYFEKDKIYYIKYNQCSPKSEVINPDKKEGATEIISFDDFKKTVFKTLKKKDVEKLIFDMRLNPGGSSYQGTVFIKKLSKFKCINQEGKLFVVIGRATFSSAIMNTLNFKKYTNALIVGEQTSGKPNHYGDVEYFELPNSKIQVSYSIKYFKMSENDVNTIIPDIEIETNYIDFKQGIDPVYEWIKKY